jgi:hypothetical protein
MLTPASQRAKYSERRETLIRERQEAANLVHSIDGAIQDVDHWLTELDAAEAAARAEAAQAAARAAAAARTGRRRGRR